MTPVSPANNAVSDTGFILKEVIRSWWLDCQEWTFREKGWVEKKLHTSLHNEELLNSEDVTDRLSRNVGRELPLHAR